MARNIPARPLSPRRRAFTLIELLIVVGIIGVLVGLTLFVGTQVVAGGKQRNTQQILQVLDQALQAYIQGNGGDNPPAVLIVKSGATNLYFPVADARDTNADGPVEAGVFPGGHPMVNSVGMFYEMGRKVEAVSKILDKIPQKYVRMYDIDGPAGPQPAMMTVFDDWNHPIRFVHPAFQGVYSDTVASTTPNPQNARPTKDVWPLPSDAPTGSVYQITEIRRNNVPTGTGPNAENQPDGDGGMCVGNRPYFYSLGPDGLCGVQKDTNSPPKVVENYNKDNVYTVIPNFVDK